MRKEWKSHHKGHSCGGGGFFSFIFTAFLVKILWNALLPGMIGVGTIGFLQAAGLLLLGKLLTGWGGPRRRRRGWDWEGKRKYWREKMKEKMESMSEEEKAEFKESFRRRGVQINVYEVEEEPDFEDEAPEEGPEEAPETDEDPPKK
ncbi:MAG: hypothetical protein AAFR61_25975 [Bacteroidota bacterium]